MDKNPGLRKAGISMKKKETVKTLQSLLFDQDGVIVDTERYGHRVAFNNTFKAENLGFTWDEEEYGHLLQVGGGKERLKFYFSEKGLYNNLSEDDLDRFIRELHMKKTGELIKMIEQHELPLRPGIHRLMKEANLSGIPIAICTTSNEKNARAILDALIPDIQVTHILAGDCVSRKKPDPEIYLKALELLNVSPDKCIVVEDSYIGTKAAKAAGLNVVATVNGYTKDEKMENADIVLSSLGEPGQPAEIISSDQPSNTESPVITLEFLKEYFNLS